MPLLAKKHVPIPNKDILSWIFDAPTIDSDKPIYIDAQDPSHSISLSQAKALIRKLIAGLTQAGVRKGDSILIHSFNNIYYPILVLSVIGCGASFCGTNPSYTSGELTYAIQKCKARLIFCDPEVLGDAITTAAKHCNLDGSCIFALDPSPPSPNNETIIKGHKSWRSLLSHGEKDWLRFNDEQTSKETNAFLFFSSGTTGLPKLTQLSHYNLIAEHELVFTPHPRPYKPCRLVALPLFHAATAPSTHISALKHGEAQIIMRRYEPHQFINLVKKHNITELMLVPPQVTSLLNLALPDQEKKDLLSSVRQTWGGVAPLDAATQNALAAFLHEHASFTQIWAMTETSCIASFLPYPEKDETGSVGRFLPNIDIKIFDEAGQDITSTGGPGELAIRGPTVTRGYIGIPRERDFDEEGYFRTGDVLKRNSENGLWYVVDRLKELIKVRGFQVAPAEVEGVLLEHPGVVDVAVIGVGNRDGTSELPRAYVVRRSGWYDRVTEEEIKNWVEQRLAKFKWLEGGVRFVEGIPKTPSGKILKRILREQVKKGEGAKL